MERFFKDAAPYRCNPSIMFYGNTLHLKPPAKDIRVRPLNESEVNRLYWAVLDNPSDGDFMVVHFDEIDDCDQEALMAHQEKCARMTQQQYNELVQAKGGGECADGNHLREVFARWAKTGATDKRLKHHALKEVYYFPNRSPKYTTLCKMIGNQKNKQHDNTLKVDFIQVAQISRVIFETMVAAGETVSSSFVTNFRNKVRETAATYKLGNVANLSCLTSLARLPAEQWQKVKKILRGQFQWPKDAHGECIAPQQIYSKGRKGQTKSKTPKKVWHSGTRACYARRQIALKCI
jgi:hypothetical protein